ncbi:MAG: DUF5615 family PIN-like protein [Chloroflexi bacterium]|nr:DUF5615 family PIN-like protein [Chloroflexota bacterium]
MARLYANENFPRQVVEKLRAPGHDILAVPADGRNLARSAVRKVCSGARANDEKSSALSRRVR